MAKPKTGLGRDFFSLLDDNVLSTDKVNAATTLRLSTVEPRSDQPRKTFPGNLWKRWQIPLPSSAFCSPLWCVKVRFWTAIMKFLRANVVGEPPKWRDFPKSQRSF